MNSDVRPRRLLVSGGSKLTPNAVLLWWELGKQLAAEDGLILITGGLRGLAHDIAAQTADYTITGGFVEGLRDRSIDPFERIETMLPDPKLDWNNLPRFEIGRVHVLKNRTSQARRFRMVYSSDVVIAIEGGAGTRSVLDVALAIERPILPLPFGGAAAGDVWTEERTEILEAFQLTEQEAYAFDQVRLSELNGDEVRSLAKDVRSCLLRGFTRRCFVIMPFHKDFDAVYEKAIEPALRTCGFTPYRTDRHVVSGNVVERIRDGLRLCYFVIADMTGDRPNVMYELGMAHANQKPVILLRRTAPSNSSSTSMPFDVSTESILFYGDNLEDLKRRLEAGISVISGRKFTVGEV